MKKIISFFLALMMVFAIVSCATSNKTDETQNGGPSATGTGSVTESDTEALTDEFYDGVPEDLTFDGNTFTVAAPTPFGVNYFFMEEDSDDPVNSALYRRNTMLEERFNIKYDYVDCGSTDNQYNALYEFTSSGDDVVSTVAVGYYQSGAGMIITYFATETLREGWIR